MIIPTVDRDSENNFGVQTRSTLFEENGIFQH
jgi:hypothetical protein